MYYFPCVASTLTEPLSSVGSDWITDFILVGGRDVAIILAVGLVGYYWMQAFPPFLLATAKAVKSFSSPPRRSSRRSSRRPPRSK